MFMDIIQRINALPPELIAKIRDDYLPVKDLHHISQVNKNSRRIKDVAIDWNKIIKRDFNKVLQQKPSLQRFLATLSGLDDDQRKYKLLLQQILSQQLSEIKLIRLFITNRSFSLNRPRMYQIHGNRTLSEFLPADRLREFTRVANLLLTLAKFNGNIIEFWQKYWQREQLLNKLNLIILNAALEQYKNARLRGAARELILSNLLTRLTTKMMSCIFDVEPSLTGLYIDNCNLYDLPEMLANFTSLETLDLGYNNLSSINIALTKLQNLRFLDLMNNKLSVLAPSIFSLRNLEILKLGNDQGMPFTLNGAFGMGFLDLRIRTNGNHFAKLPPQIEILTNLRQLHIQSVGLTALPVELAQCRQLEHINFIHNEVRFVPEAIMTLGPRMELYGNPIFGSLAAETFSRHRFNTISYVNQLFWTYIDTNPAVVELRTIAANSVAWIRAHPLQAAATIGMPLLAMYIEKLRKNTEGCTEDYNEINFGCFCRLAP